MTSGSPVGDVEEQRPQHIALAIRQQVHREELVEEVGLRPQVLLVEGVQQRVPGSIGRGAGCALACSPPKCWL